MPKLGALSGFYRGEEGVTSIEYALLGMLIAVAIVAAVSGLGTVVNDMYTLIPSKIPG